VNQLTQTCRGTAHPAGQQQQNCVADRPRVKTWIASIFSKMEIGHGGGDVEERIDLRDRLGPWPAKLHGRQKRLF